MINADIVRFRDPITGPPLRRFWRLPLIGLPLYAIALVAWEGRDVNLFRLAAAVVLMGFIWWCFFVLRQVSTWVELSAKELTWNRLAGIGPGGPTSERMKLRYEQIRAAKATKGNEVSISYWNDRKSKEEAIRLEIDESLRDDFLKELNRRLTERGVAIDIEVPATPIGVAHL